MGHSREYLTDIGPDLVARRLAEGPRYVFKDPSVRDDARQNALASLERIHARARDHAGSNRSIETPELAIALSARGRIGFRHESGLAASASLLDHDTQVTSGPGLTSSFQDPPNDRTYLRSTTAWYSSSSRFVSSVIFYTSPAK